MKKLTLLIILFFSLFVISVYGQSQKSATPEERKSWWSITADDPELRKKFEELNAKYFDGELKVKYIGYGHNLLADGLAGATFYWCLNSESSNAGCSVITIDDELFVNDPVELERCILHEMCHVYANMHDKDAEIPGIDGHTLSTYKLIMKYLIQIGANPRTGEGIVSVN